MKLTRSGGVPTFADYRRYKPYLRTDFRHCCAYCLLHESHLGGYAVFHVDHFRPSSRPEFARLKTHYPNLFFACPRCNRFKSDLRPTAVQQRAGYDFLDPTAEDAAAHYRFAPDGTAAALSRKAAYTLEHCRLNRPALVKLRRELSAAASDLIDDLAHLARVREKIQRLRDIGPIDDIDADLARLEDRARRQFALLVHARPLD